MKTDSPRVTISWDRNEKHVELPFVIGVLADLSGEHGDLAPVEARKFLEVARYCFDDFLKTCQPSVMVQAPDWLGAGSGDFNEKVIFESMADFAPAKIALRTPGLQELAKTDGRLSEGVRSILHHPDFMALESAWRGLSYLVEQIGAWREVKVRVLNLSKRALREMLDGGDHPGVVCLLEQLLNEEFERSDGEPFGALVGDYYFERSVEDIRTLRELARIAAGAHCPFISGAHPRFLGLETWLDANEVPTIDQSPGPKENEEWTNLRESRDSLYVGLTAPRVLARLPYGTRGQPVREFAFEEEAGGEHGSRFVWMNSVYVMAFNIARSVAECGWPTQIAGAGAGGKVSNLPVYIASFSGGAAGAKRPFGPTEISIPDCREHELGQLGLMALCQIRHTPDAAFVGACSLHWPKRSKSGDPAGATELPAEHARLPHIFACSRFAQALLCMIRDLDCAAVPSLVSKEQLRGYLQRWLTGYSAVGSERARKPLRAGKVEINEFAEQAENYEGSGTLTITPTYKLPTPPLTFVVPFRFHVRKPPRMTPENVKTAPKPLSRGRVEMRYTVSLDGTPRVVELPFVIGVMAGLSGSRQEPLPRLSERHFQMIDLQNFDAVMEAAKPRLALQVENTLAAGTSLSLDLVFSALDDFSPWSVARQVPTLRVLLEHRDVLVSQAARNQDLSELRLILERAVAEQWSLPAISNEFVVQMARKASWELVAEIDRVISKQVNIILHQPDFQALEATWRGLYFFVRRGDPKGLLRVKVLNVAHEELSEVARDYPGMSLFESPIFGLVHRELDMLGGEPFGVLVGDYAFGHSPEDVQTLQSLGKIAAASHAPFLGAAAPALLAQEKWPAFRERPFSRVVELREYDSWRALRDHADAGFLALTTPRFLVRQPWARDAKPENGFDFAEDTEGGNPRNYVWVNSAYAMAANIAHAFNEHGWWGRLCGLQGGGSVANLKSHCFQTSEGLDCTRLPVEVEFTDKNAHELEVHFGLNVLQYNKQLMCGVFPSAHSLGRTKPGESVDEWFPAGFSNSLSYLLPVCRCIHYIQAILRDHMGVAKERREIQDFLNQWIASYVLIDPNASEEVKAQRPFSEAEIKVENVAGVPGHYNVQLRCRPHFQVEELSQPLDLVARVSSEGV